MKCAVMQPYFFPYIGYWQLINIVDTFIIFDDVNYIKKGWINRNRILVNNKAFLFTLPIIGATQNKKINQLKIDINSKWSGKFLNTLHHNYKKAPYFDDVYNLIKIIINSEIELLSSYIYNSIVLIHQYLNGKTKIIPTSSIYENQNLNAEERIIDICIHEKATKYINPIGGLELYSRENFQKKGIDLFFLKTNEIEYQQSQDNHFVPNLSIIDIMMYNSKEIIDKFLNACTLISRKNNGKSYNIRGS